jgi:OPT family oligopeptide transporter
MTEGDDDEEVDIELESHAHSEDVVAHSSLSDENEWHSKMRALVWSFSISGIYTLAAHLIPVLGAIPLADWLTGFRIPFSEWNWYLTPSLSYAGQGIIMGMSTTVSMLMGSIVGWGILGPIAKVWGWAPGPVNDAKTGARGWIIWISLAIMIAESIVSLSVVTIEEIVKRWQASHGTSGWEASVLETQRARTRHHLLNNDDETPKGWLVPSWVTYSGLAVSSLLCVFTCSVLFDMSWHIGILSVAIACLLSILAVRALGETDLNPVSGIGKVSQVVFAGVAPGNIVVNLIAGGVAEAGAQQAGDMMQDLKTGHLLHASPRAQFYGQLIGSAVSVPVAAFAYATFSAAYQIPGPEFQAPTALVWLEMSRLVNGQPLPVNSGPFILLSALLFALLPILRIALPNARFHRYMPSGIAFAMGIYTTPNYVLPRVLGALGAHLYSRYSQLHGTRTKESLAVLIIVVASGFVLGEGTFSLVNLVLKVNGIGPIACVGCIPGLCSGC